MIELRSTLWYASWSHPDLGVPKGLRALPSLGAVGGKASARGAPLAPLPPPLSYDRLLAMCPDLEAVLYPLRDSSWLDGVPLENQLPGPLTRDTALLMATVQQGLLRYASKRELRLVGPLFTVPKKDDTLRVIYDARGSNAVLPDVEPLVLPPWSHVRNLMANAKVFAMLDAMSFFHQFELQSRALRSLCGVRGKCGLLVYTRACQGLKILPSICHRVSARVLAHTGCLGIPWIDNLLLLDSQAASNALSYDKVRSTFESVGITLSSDPSKSFHSCRQGEALGAYWDLVHRRLRPTSSFLDTVRHLLQEVLARDARGEASSALDLYVVLGSQVWWCTVGEVPLCHVPLVPLFMSFVGGRARQLGWDVPCPLWSSVRLLWSRWLPSLTEDFYFPLTRDQVPRGPPMHISTDASTWGGVLLFVTPLSLPPLS
jgi:hypothetical protein